MMCRRFSYQGRICTAAGPTDARLTCAPTHSPRPSALTRLRQLTLHLALPILLVGAAGPAVAQDKATLDRLNELDRQALADYAADDFESARLGLREAITLAGRAGLAADPIMAHLWADLGALYLNGFHDKPKGQKALSLAVKIKADVRPSDSMLTPEVKEVLASLATAGAAAPPGAPPAASPAAPGTPPGVVPPAAPAGATAPGPAAPAVAAPPPKPAPPRRKRGAGTEPDLPANIPTPLYCPSLDEAPPEEDVVMYCVLGPDIEAKRITLFYRAAGAEKWTSAATKKSELGWIKAVLPGSAVQGKSLQFYLEARDGTDKVVGNAGRDDSPNLLFVRDGVDSLANGVWAGMQAKRDGDSVGPVVDEDPLRALVDQRDRERAAEGIHRRRAGAFFIGLSIGSGYGWHPKERLEFYDDAEIQEGLIPSGLFQLVPALGYQVSDRFALSLEARAQFIAQTGSGDQKAGAPATGAFLLLARAQYFIGGGNFQGSASLLAGVGDGFRLTIGPQPGTTYRRNDSVRGGPLALGAGLGAIYHFSRHLGLVADLRGLAGFPTSALVGDFTGGLNLSF